MSAIELKKINKPMFEVGAPGKEGYAVAFDLLIDIAAPLPQIMEDLRAALRPFKIPSRAIDRRILKGVYLLQIGECRGPAEASRRVFGTERHAEKIRYWFNRLKGVRK